MIRRREMAAPVTVTAVAVIGLLAAVTVATTERSAEGLLTLALVSALAVVAAAMVMANRRLRRSDSLHAVGAAQLRTVQHGLTEAIQIFGPDGILVSRNPAADRIFEMDAADLSREALIAKWEFIGEDRVPMSVEGRPLAIAMRTGVSAERVVVGIRKRTDQTVKWLSMSTFPIRGDHFEALGFISCASEITEQMQANRELQVFSRASEEMGSSLVPAEVIRALTGGAADLCSNPGEPPRRAQLFIIDGPMLIVTGEHDTVSGLSSEGERVPITEHPYVQKAIALRRAVIAELHYEEFGPAVANAMGRHHINNCVWVPMMRDGRVFAVLSVAGRQLGLVTSSQVQRLTTLATMGELALANAEAHARMAELALTDPLTGVGNRRALEDRLRQMARSRFALVAIDVDDLKKVNDTHGHHAGDELLATLAPALAAELRPSDMLARIGGDEFLALLVDCDAHGALEMERRLERAARRVRLASGTPTVSVGSAAGAAGAAPQVVAKAADMALYSAKQARAELASAGQTGAAAERSTTAVPD